MTMAKAADDDGGHCGAEKEKSKSAAKLASITND